jgi:uncharacterized protein YdhG (YjbR/CyaY superfamily)
MGKASEAKFGRVKTNNPKPTTIDEFIAQYPQDLRERLETIRTIIRKGAPKATEAISYGIPAFKLNGNFLFFSAFRDHVAIYPRVKALEKELAQYPGGKGTIKFPIDKPLPLALIRKIVKVKLQENLERAEAKANKAMTEKAKRTATKGSNAKKK